QFNLEVDFLLAGIDGAGTHLSHVTNPGVLSPLQKLGHAAIGTGGNHAMLRLSLDRQSRHRGLFETLSGVYTAKRASEVAPGVGNATDIAIIDERHGIWHCTQPVLDVLDRIYQTVSAALTHDLGDLTRTCDEEWQ